MNVEVDALEFAAKFQLSMDEFEQILDSESPGRQLKELYSSNKIKNVVPKDFYEHSHGRNNMDKEDNYPKITN